MKTANDIFKETPLHGIKLRHDRRIKYGNFVPDSRAGKFYRVHPDTIKRVDIEIAKSSNAATTPLRLAYRAFVLNPPIVIGMPYVA